MDLLEADWATTLLNVTRDVAHSQLKLHAKGVEHFSEARRPPLPPPRRACSPPRSRRLWQVLTQLEQMKSS